MSPLLALRGVGAGQVAAKERAAAQFRRLGWSVLARADRVRHVHTARLSAWSKHVIVWERAFSIWC